MNTVYVAANVIVCAKPMRIPHVLHPLLYGLVYLIFSLIYQKSTDIVVYTQLDWDNMPQTAFFMLGVLLLILPFLYFMCLTVTRLRQLLCKKLCRKKTTVSPQEIEGDNSHDDSVDDTRKNQWRDSKYMLIELIRQVWPLESSKPNKKKGGGEQRWYHLLLTWEMGHTIVWNSHLQNV